MQTKINFADGTSIVLNDGDSLIPIRLIDVDGTPSASLTPSVELHWHHHDGLIPSILDVLLTSEYFKVVGKPDIVYGTKTVVYITNL